MLVVGLQPQNNANNDNEGNRGNIIVELTRQFALRIDISEDDHIILPHIAKVVPLLPIGMKQKGILTHSLVVKGIICGNVLLGIDEAIIAQR